MLSISGGGVSANVYRGCNGARPHKYIVLLARYLTVSVAAQKKDDGSMYPIGIYRGKITSWVLLSLSLGTSNSMETFSAIHTQIHI